MENMENQTDDLKGRVKAVLETLRPALQMDGGDAELVDVKEGVVLLRLMGACAGCPMSTMTLKMGIEQRMKAEVPEIVSVEAV
jgi:Fe-S cluster biogenesis protein NfuA